MSIKWENYSITYREESLIMAEVLKLQNDYNYFTSANMNKLAKILKRIVPRKKWITPLHVLSMRRSYLRNLILINHGYVFSKKTHIRELYDEGMSIVDIAKKYQYSPVMIFRILLQARGMSKVIISKITIDPSCELANSYLSKRDKQELEDAIKNDIINLPDQSPIIDAADRFEVDLEKFFDKYPHQTQEHMVKEQTLLYGKAIATPDLYFPDGVMVNGKKLFWIDAKNFYGANISNIRSSLVKQAKRYTQLYGAGAYIFKYSYSTGLTKAFGENVLLLGWY